MIMKKITIVFLFLNVTMSFAAVVKTINVPTAGKLSLYLSSYITTVTDLTLTGNIDARDLKYIRDNVQKISMLDISMVTIQPYTGTEGTADAGTIFYPANEMPQNSFYSSLDNISRKSIITVKLPNSILSIGAYAFNGCSSLSLISIPETVKIIGDHAFAGCSGFTGSLIIPNSVTIIGPAAFSNCSNLTGSLLIPNSVTTIGSGAFNSCSKLTGSLIIPNSITAINSSTFSGCKGLTNIFIPNTVKMIGSSAFLNCIGLTGSIDIPNSVTYIDNDAFNGCSSVTGRVYIPMAVSQIGSNAFKGCSGFFEVDSENMNFASNDSVLFDKSKMTLIQCLIAKKGNYDIPSFVKIIAPFAFYGCSNLVKLSVPSNVESIGGYAFSNCTSLASLDLPFNFSGISLGSSIFSFCSNLSTVVAPFGNDSLGKSLFSYSQISSIIIPEGVTIVKSQAFSKNFSSVTNIKLPSTLNSIETSAFSGCSSLKSIKFPNSVTAIGVSAFQDCPSLKDTLFLPSSLMSIAGYAFSGCSKLPAVAISSNVKSIGNFAFQNCTGLKGKQYLPSSVKLIGVSSFQGCNGLTAFVIPSSVSVIGSSAFSGCTALSSIYAYPVSPIDLTSSTTVFNGVDKSNCTLYVPTGSLASYWVANQWKDFLNIVEGQLPDAINYVSTESLMLYPSMVKEGFYVKGNLDKVIVSVYDLNGKLVMTKIISDNTFISASTLSKGNYIVKIKSSNKAVTQKIVKI